VLVLGIPGNSRVKVDNLGSGARALAVQRMGAELCLVLTQREALAVAHALTCEPAPADTDIVQGDMDDEDDDIRH
jgi:hypothetical protein